jgi:amidase
MVADLRVALGVMAGEDWRDPWSVPAPLDIPGAARDVRVALAADPEPGGTAEEIQAAVRASGAALADRGFAVEETEPPPVAEAAYVWLDILKGDMSTAMETMTPPWGQEQATFVEKLFELGSASGPTRTLEAYIARLRLQRAWARFLDGDLVVVAPVCGRPPFAACDSLADVAGTFASLCITTAANTLGLPAVAVPVGMANGLPVGVQVIAGRFKEELCLSVAAAIESAFPPLTPIDPH